MTRKFILVLIMLAPFLAEAQISGIINRAKSKVNQRVNNKVDEAIDKTLDEAEGKPSGNSTVKQKPAETKEQTGFKSYSRFDFIPGEQILYAEDFSQDAIGELPLEWNTTGKAETVMLEGFSGNWLRMYQNSFYLTANKKEFTKNFTVEFDLILQLNYKSYSFPLVSFGMLATNDLPTTDNKVLKDPILFQSAEIQLRPGTNGNNWVSLKTFLNRTDFFRSQDQQLTALDQSYNKVCHISMQVQEGRLRIWVNAEKIVDLPKALPTEYIFNQLFFKIHNSGYKEQETGFYLGNIKAATGVPDTRHKLVEEGSFSTTGILFDVNAATIKPESFGVIKEVAAVLKEHAQVKIKIIGHTDADGSDAANLTLSQKRAIAVKDALISEYGIDAGRIETDGKGEAAPVADNKIKEGKAANRRVEFIKL